MLLCSSTNTTERNAAVADGYVLEDSPGFVYTSQICASVPLYRLFLVDGTDHFYTSKARLFWFCSTEHDNT